MTLTHNTETTFSAVKSLREEIQKNGDMKLNANFYHKGRALQQGCFYLLFFYFRCDLELIQFS